MPNIKSFEQCASECEQNASCFQASFDGTDCTLGTRHFRLGEKRVREGNKKWQSMWIKKRMADWAQKNSNCANHKIEFRDAFVCK